MNLYFRLLWLLLTAWQRPKLQLLDDSVTEFRVLPNDLDTNLHMNNGRYLTIMDLGRTDMILRLDFLKTMLKRRWYPVVGYACMHFRRSLDPFQKYQLHTRIIGWDEKWFYMEQRFRIGDKVVAIGRLRGLFMCGRDKVSSTELIEALGYGEHASPEMPAGFERWFDPTG